MRDFLVLCQTLPPNAALEYAATIATRGSGRVTGIHVQEPLPVVADAMFPAASAALYGWLAETLANARAAETPFRAWARERGLAGAAWIVAQGPLPATVAHAAQWHDVVVAPRADDEPWGTPARLGRIVVAARRPVIVLPPALAKAAKPALVAIAWNGSSEAARAVHDALPLLRGARRVVVFEGEPGRRFDGMEEPPRLELEPWLHAHGVAAEFARVEGDDPGVGAMVLARASEAGADLLVMGGYGHSRAAELVLGGVTRHVLAHATIPVLFSH
jgi:nucleotide-binding universal stress UspA family protein